MTRKSISVGAQKKAIKEICLDVPGWMGLVHTHEAQSVLERYCDTDLHQVNSLEDREIFCRVDLRHHWWWRDHSSSAHYVSIGGSM